MFATVAARNEKIACAAAPPPVSPMPAGRRAESDAYEVQQVLGVGAVDDREGGIEADRGAVQPQQAIGDAVERPRPWDRELGRVTATRMGRANASRARRHLAGGPAREREQQDP